MALSREVGPGQKQALPHQAPLGRGSGLPLLTWTSTSPGSTAHVQRALWTLQPPRDSLQAGQRLMECSQAQGGLAAQGRLMVLKAR